MNPRVLVVDDETENLKAIERTLRDMFHITLCDNAYQALELVKKEEFSVVVCDNRMPGMLGTELLAQLGIIKPLTTRIILTAFTEAKDMLDAINRAEIYRYLTKPWNNNELRSTVSQGAERYRLLKDNEKLIHEMEIKTKSLVAKEKELVALNQNLERLVEQRTSELRSVNEKLSELALTDPLTRVHNRRAFFARFKDELERSKRYKHPISVAMIDVDYFKSFNDSQGHLCGDEALKRIVQTLTGKLRRTDFICRFGGEEFLLMMPETQLSMAKEICERIRLAVEETAFQGQNETAYLTVSIGISGFPEQGTTEEELIKAADDALYQAKGSGRNCVIKAD